MAEKKAYFMLRADGLMPISA